MFSPETRKLLAEHAPEPVPQHTPVPVVGPLSADRSNLVQSLVLRDVHGNVIGALHVALPYLCPPGETEDQRKARLEDIVTVLQEQINEDRS